MVSLFSSLNIASNALSVNESAISVVSHNIANMNTEGYSKQKVNLATRNIAGSIGDNVENQIRANGGVMIANVKRYTDEYLNNYYRDQNSILKGYEQQLGNLDDLAEILNDLEGTGIDAALSDFYEALNNLNEYPASSTARINLSNLLSKICDVERLAVKISNGGINPRDFIALKDSLSLIPNFKSIFANFSSDYLKNLNRHIKDIRLFSIFVCKLFANEFYVLIYVYIFGSSDISRDTAVV